MAGLSYGMEIRFDPADPVAGEWVEITVQLSNVTGVVEKVQASVASYGVSATLSPRGENVFATRAFVPWAAVAARYLVAFRAMNSAGEVGPLVEVPVTVKVR